MKGQGEGETWGLRDGETERLRDGELRDLEALGDGRMVGQRDKDRGDKGKGDKEMMGSLKDKETD